MIATQRMYSGRHLTGYYLSLYKLCRLDLMESGPLDYEIKRGRSSNGGDSRISGSSNSSSSTSSSSSSGCCCYVVVVVVIIFLVMLVSVISST